MLIELIWLRNTNDRKQYDENTRWEEKRKNTRTKHCVQHSDTVQEVYFFTDKIMHMLCVLISSMFHLIAVFLRICVLYVFHFHCGHLNRSSVETCNRGREKCFVVFDNDDESEKRAKHTFLLRLFCCVRFHYSWLLRCIYVI